jgi:hypothetical protein
MIPFSYIHWHVSTSLVSPSELRFLAVISTGMYPPMQYPFLRCDSLQLLYIHWNVSTTAVSLSELWFLADISTGMYSPVKFPLLSYDSLQLYICHVSTISEKHVQNTRSSCEYLARISLACIHHCSKAAEVSSPGLWWITCRYISGIYPPLQLITYSIPSCVVITSSYIPGMYPSLYLCKYL